MKKLFFALAIAFSFIAVSCGSKNETVETTSGGGVDSEVIELEDEAITEDVDATDELEVPTIE